MKRKNYYHEKKIFFFTTINIFFHEKNSHLSQSWYDSKVNDIVVRTVFKPMEVSFWTIM